VASIFVNPTQFGPSEDFSRYPRDLEGDLAKCAAAGIDRVLAPTDPALVFAPVHETWVSVERASVGLCGASRPGHFRGVATVCLKLFNIVRPDRAYFGQKDAQQGALVDRMARDLDLELEIVVVPTVRDEDGVAASSRNAYLSSDERDAARALPRALDAGARAHRAGDDAAEAAKTVLAREPRLAPEYVEVARLDGRVYLLAAVRSGNTRLIDNVVLEEVAE
jgi:pantoate--beta-alanine ligase